MSDEDEPQEYTGPLLSRHIAELLGIPLDDPDVIAAVAAGEAAQGGGVVPLPSNARQEA